MKCNQCEYLFINGVGCHETGCPNIKRTVDCDICGYEVVVGEPCCVEEEVA
jgi:hypothetical protein